MASEPATRIRTPDLEQELGRFHPDSFGWACACCGWNRDEAEEVLQTSYVKALQGRAKFNGHSSARTWFFGVVRRTAQERRRRRATRLIALRRWFAREPRATLVPTPETASADVELQRTLHALLQRLAARQREVLHLVFYQELTIEQAAEVLHLSLGSARTHYERGKTRLRKLLTQSGGRP